MERELGPAPSAPATREDALLPAQTADQPRAYSGPYAAGTVWAVREGEGDLVDERTSASRSTAPGRLALVKHPHHTEGDARAQGRPRACLPRHLLHARRRGVARLGPERRRLGERPAGR